MRSEICHRSPRKPGCRLEALRDSLEAPSFLRTTRDKSGQAGGTKSARWTNAFLVMTAEGIRRDSQEMRGWHIQKPQVSAFARRQASADDLSYNNKITSCAASSAAEGAKVWAKMAGAGRVSNRV